MSRHPPPPEPGPEPQGWELRHSPYTFEGRIEGLGRFASGSHRVPGWRRWVAVVLALSFLLPVALGLVGYVVSLLGG